MPPPGSKTEIEALKALLDSARDLVADIADESMERALRSLARLPPEERGVIALALDRAVTSWQANEAFGPLNHVRLRANPHAQFFVRVFDPVPEEPFQQLDIVPETLRVMKRLAILIHPEARAIWEEAVATALPMLTTQEWTDCVRFLELALAAATARTPGSQEPGVADAGTTPSAEGAERDKKAGS
ncbi:MAG TPA: hypothetical protein VMS22_19795 [Candidatus Eisenbacteria bacterium]|nr:hypothetical protein [Candidatus Eisenbacteria bacterium]